VLPPRRPDPRVGPDQRRTVGPFKSATASGGTGVRTLTVKNIRPLPDNIALLVGDAVHNIRAALDHFVWAAVSNPDWKTMFPVWGRNAAPKVGEWQDEVDRRLSGASPDLRAAVVSLQPWVTGNDSQLWYIHELDRIDKHRLSVSVAAANTRVIFEVASIFNPVPGLRPSTMSVATLDLSRC
jgi:hypothetical protein